MWQSIQMWDVQLNIADSCCKQKQFEDFAEYLFVYRKSDTVKGSLVVPQ
jgi:hypothetical protein